MLAFSYQITKDWKISRDMLYIIMLLYYVLIVYLYVFAASVYIYRHNTTSNIVIYAKHEMVMSDMRQKCLLQPEMRRQGNNGLQI